MTVSYDVYMRLHIHVELDQKSTYQFERYQIAPDRNFPRRPKLIFCMPLFSFTMDGFSAGLASVLASKLEEKTTFAAFKMPHPLETTSHVIISSSDKKDASNLILNALSSTKSELASLIASLPTSSDANNWPEHRCLHKINVRLDDRQISEEP